MISRRPTVVMAPACSWPMAILRIISPSLPCVPPAYTLSTTLPLEAAAQRAPISCSSVCQVEPCGASVPSLMRISCARAAGAARTATAPRTERRAERSFMVERPFER